MGDLDKFESRGSGTKEVTVTGNNDSFVAIIEKLSANPDVPVDKFKQIMEMQEHIMDRNAEQAFNFSMAQAQSKIKVVAKTKKNDQTHSKYSPLEEIVKHATPIYTGEGFSLSFYQGDTAKENHIRVMCDIMHEQGHTKTRYGDFAIDSSGIKGNVNKTMIHAQGSTFTYGRRYLTCMIFNIPTGDDDDGNSAGKLPEYIDEKQLSQITDMINSKNVDEIAFLKFMRVDSAHKLLSKQFKAAMFALKKAKGKPDREPGSDDE